MKFGEQEVSVKCWKTETTVEIYLYILDSRLMRKNETEAGKCRPTGQVLAGNDTVPNSVCRGRGTRSTECRSVHRLLICRVASCRDV